REVGHFEVGPFKVGLQEGDPLKVGSLEVRLLEVSPIKNGPRKVGSLEVRLLEVNPIKNGTLKFGSLKVGEVRPRTAHIYSYQPCFGKLRTEEIKWPLKPLRSDSCSN